MDGRSAFDQPGKFWRGNIHGHSNRSDGKYPVDEVCRRYRKAGYDFITVSDHFTERYGYPITDTRDFRTNSFTTILGAELHAPTLENGEIWHMVAAGLPLDFQSLADGETGPKLAERALATGAFLGLAHPEWNGLTFDDARSIPGAHSIEIYNHGCYLECDRGNGAYILDALVSEGRKLTTYACDDSHLHIDDMGGGWMVVKSAENEPDALVEAMKAGHTYSTQGPEIRSLEVNGDVATLECTGVEAVMAVGRRARWAAVTGAGITRAEVPLEKFKDDWFRVVIRDAAGKRAWSNPVYLA